MTQEVSREVPIVLRALEEDESILESPGSDWADRDLIRVRQLKQLYERNERIV